MNIAIIGYGKMGKEIEKIAKSRNHNITLIIDKDNTENLKDIKSYNIDVAIEFTNADVAINNYKHCLDADIPIVSGTTGINKTVFNEIIDKVKSENKTFFWASNFSIGVNIAFKVNEYLAKLMNKQQEYDVEIKEIHHIHKLDSPSGTAISFAEGILSNIERKHRWKNDYPVSDDEIYIKSVREGEVPGTHIIKYKSEIDILELKHEAFGRKGFALGSVLAAEFVQNKKGVFSMNDLL